MWIRFSYQTVSNHMQQLNRIKSRRLLPSDLTSVTEAVEVCEVGWFWQIESHSTVAANNAYVITMLNMVCVNVLMCEV